MSAYTITITLTPEEDAALRARARHTGSTAEELLGRAARSPLAAPRTDDAGRVLVFRAYLDETARAGDISEETAGRAWEAWLRLSREMGGCLTVPDAAPGDDGELLLTWDQDDLHLELEFLPDHPAEFFSRERQAHCAASGTSPTRPSRWRHGSG